jgi:hypothetical protein
MHNAALSSQTLMMYGYQSLVYIWLTKQITIVAHPDNVEEYSRLVDQAKSICKILIDDMIQHILRQLTYVSDTQRSIEDSCRPIESGNRLQKSLDAKRRRIKETPDPLPGYESAIWIKNVLTKFKAAKANLGLLVAAIESQRFFLVYGQEYDLHYTLFKSIYSFFDSKLQSLYFTSVSNQIERSSITKLHYETFCGAVQSCLSSLTISTSFPSYLRASLCRELIDDSLPPPGVPVVCDVAAALKVVTRDAKPKSPPAPLPIQPTIKRISIWLESVIDQLLAPKGNHVYVDKLNSIVPLPLGRNISITSADIDTRLNVEDLRIMCSLIGPQGVRAVDAHLLQLVSAKVSYLRI